VSSIAKCRSSPASSCWNSTHTGARTGVCLCLSVRGAGDMKFIRQIQTKAFVLIKNRHETVGRGTTAVSRDRRTSRSNLEGSPRNNWNCKQSRRFLLLRKWWPYYSCIHGALFLYKGPHLVGKFSCSGWNFWRNIYCL